MIFFLIFLFESCGNSNENSNTNQKNSSGVRLKQNEDNSVYVRFSSFQNPDSTWGFTIFVDSRPFLLYKKIPLMREKSGFESKRDADLVGRLFMDMVKAGDASPKLTMKALDTLGIVIGKKRHR